MNIVRSLLKKSPLVESFKPAPSEAGGWGATIAYLRPSHSLSILKKTGRAPSLQQE